MAKKRLSASKTPKKLPVAIWVAIIGLGVPVIAGLINILVTIISLPRTPTPIPTFAPTPTPFSGKISFSSESDLKALNPNLKWEPGNSSLSHYTLTSESVNLVAGPHTWQFFPEIQYKPNLEDNFDVQVKLTFTSPLRSLDTAQMAGLIVRPVKARLVLGDASFPDDWVVVAKSITTAGHLVGARGTWVKYPASEVYLRAERANDAWRCAYSENGENWTWIEPKVDESLSMNKEMEMALFVYSDTDDSLEVVFSDWIISSN